MSENQEAPIRDAASLLLLRGDGSNPDVLMGMRGAGHTFMPNRLVFPGGAVDPQDHTAALASSPSASVLSRLAAGADASLAHAIAHAAARELEEETGLHLGHPPALAELDYFCRAITPPGMRTRFDARFLAIDARHVGGTLAGSGELEDLRWYGLAETLGLDLAFPTRKVLEQLAVWLALPLSERRALPSTPTLRERVWLQE